MILSWRMMIKYFVVYKSLVKNIASLLKNAWFRTIFAFYSILKSQVWIGTWSQGHLVHRSISWLLLVKMCRGKRSKKKSGFLTNFCFLLFKYCLNVQILIDLMTAIRSCDIFIIYRKELLFKQAEMA